MQDNLNYIDLNKFVEAANSVPDVDCKEVDVEQIEEMGLEVANKVQDLVVNIDISNL